MLYEGVLQVRMLGEFSMTWEGKEICGGPKTSDAQCTRLLQLLLYNRKEGIERTKLQSLLLDDSNSEDVHHLLRTIIYNTRRKLAGSGLPEVQYIEFRNGRYYWTQKIPVQLDTESFEALCEEAAEEQDDEMKLKKCLKAVFAYKGSFLPNQTRLTWATAEESRYRTLFTECVEEAVNILRKKSDYEGIEKLGRIASAKCPLNEWEYLMLEAYIHTGKIREAQDLYEQTIEYYQKKLGIESIRYHDDKVERFLKLVDRQYFDINDLEKDLQEEQDSECGFYCSYPVFRGICQLIKRATRTDVLSPYLILCSVNKQCFRNMHDVEAFEKQEEQAKHAICSAADRDTVICRCCRGQFVILIPDGSNDICHSLEDRINSNLGKDGYGQLLLFSILPLIEEEKCN